MRKLLEEDRLRQLIAVGPALISELDLDVLLPRLLETARSVTAAKYAALGILDQQRRELERFITSGLSEEEERAIGAPPRGRGVLGLVIEDPRPIRVADVTAHPKSYGFPPRHPPMRTFLGVPVVIRGQAWGNLYLTDKRIGEFNDADEYAAVTLATWAAIAIDHARLLAGAVERQARLEAAVRRLEATQAVSMAAGADMDPARLLDLIASRGRAIVEARDVVVLRLEGAELAVASRAGDTDAEIGARLQIAESGFEQVMLAKRPARVDDPSPQLRASATRLGVPEVASALLVPLMHRGAAVGVMAAFDPAAGSPDFDDADEQALVAFAASAAVAVGQHGRSEQIG